MTPSSAKPTTPAPTPASDTGQTPERLNHPATASRRRADLEAQKRYMDERFGRDRPLNPKRSA